MIRRWCSTGTLVPPEHSVDEVGRRAVAGPHGHGPLQHPCAAEPGVVSVDQGEALPVKAVSRQRLRNRGGEAPQVPRERSEAAEGERALDAGCVPNLQDSAWVLFARDRLSQMKRTLILHARTTQTLKEGEPSRQHAPTPVESWLQRRVPVRGKETEEHPLELDGLELNALVLRISRSIEARG